MNAPNRSTLWGQIVAEELVAGGLEGVCVAPGSRSTPLTLAFADHPDVTVYSHLDERSAGFFALGRSRRIGEPTALVCTSGTAVANFHPAVIEADRGRVPLIVLTADRPPELRESGANQTIDQRDIYGGAVRWSVDLCAPTTDERTLRSLRTTVSRALTKSQMAPPGPVHLNCPFRKPLEPTPNAGDVHVDSDQSVARRDHRSSGAERDDGSSGAERDSGSSGAEDNHGASGEKRNNRSSDAEYGRDGAFVDAHVGRPSADATTVSAIADALVAADRPMIVAGTTDPATTTAGSSGPSWAESVVRLAATVGAPVLADPLSGLRFDPAVADAVVPGGYDAYVEIPEFEPDVVLSVGHAPTSQSLQSIIERSGARRYVVDAAGAWHDPTFTATDHIVSDPVDLVERLASSVESTASESIGDRSAGTPGVSDTNDERSDWLDRFETAEAIVDDVLASATTGDAHDTAPFEGAILETVLARTPDPSTVFVSNSMPIRDADRFGRPRAASVAVLGNRGASGIDGIVSTALGAGVAADEPLTLVTGDLALYHDSNGLLAIDRCDVDATIVVIDNDGGGIFHMLPIENFDPAFTKYFKTPHGLDFAALAELYGLTYESVEVGGFGSAYEAAVERDGSRLISVEVDAEASHRRREAVSAEIRTRVEDAVSE